MMTVCGYYLVAKEHHWMACSPNCKSGQYGGNELPCRGLRSLSALVQYRVHIHGFR